MFQCKECLEYKFQGEFYKNPTSKLGFTSRCRRCIIKRNLERRKADPDNRAKRSKEYEKAKFNTEHSEYLTRKSVRRLKTEYGLTPQDIDELIKSQDGVCAICRGSKPAVVKKYNKNGLCIDHCHQTGKIRGLLCSLCNLGLGAFKDDIESLSAAVIYLKNNREEKDHPYCW